MPTTFTKIASVTVGSGGASSIDFTSIPSTYTDLCLKLSARTNESSDRTNLYLRFNSNAANYSYKQLYGNGSSAVSTTGSSQAQAYLGVIDGATATSSTFGNAEIYVPSYAASNYKSISFDGINENNATQAFAFLSANLWSDTSAITAVNILPSGGTSFVQYSTATLYGIKNS